MEVQSVSRPNPEEHLRTWAEFEIKYLREPAVDVGGCPRKFIGWEELGSWPA